MSISPGPTNTALFTTNKPQEVIDRLVSLFALNRLGEPEDIVNTHAFLASDEAKWITAQGMVNGGMSSFC